ncbi:hypothetical protein GO730_37030 [Spirosoma sp. HMF3257]|uniref:DUF3784 domain-containing protein n=1 Tax=Spirosoma telluris TaxID=2183553 RepID=A0A327NSK4_9BACT|nr:hypothetical protein [Spirosoma telluris]RAI78267.1 hypothetical protein HMF3257_36960 [Spirosoma telluris]
MNIFMFIIGLGIMLLGVAIWRFKLINILSNVDMSQVDLTKKDDLARYAGCFLLLIGGIFSIVAYLLGLVETERGILVLLACIIPLIMVSCIFYLAGLGRYMKK